MYRKTMSILIALVWLVCAPTAWADDPQIQNLEVHQREGSYEIEINYDLVCVDCDSVSVTAWCSLDGGETWSCQCASVSGAAGPYVSPGEGLQIVWDARADLPGVLSEQARIRLEAEVVQPLPYISQVWRTDLYGKNQQSFAKCDTLMLSWGDTIGFGEGFRMGWYGVAPAIAGMTPEQIAAVDTVFPYDDGLLGYQYQLPGQTVWHPLRFSEATGDSLSYFGDENSVVFLNDGSGTDPRQDFLANGLHRLGINTLDIFDHEVAETGRDFWFVVNYDPETVVLDGQKDWAHPEDPQTYPYYVLMNDPLQERHEFQSGDRVPDRAYVVCKALMRDDPRDLILDPGHEVGLSGYVTGTISTYGGALYSYQTPSSDADRVPAWPAGGSGWSADTLGFLVSPSTEVTVNLRAVDEHGRRDGTPAQLTFDVGYAPCVQCVETVPHEQASAFGPDVDCCDGSASHVCFDDETTLYVAGATATPQPDRTYLSRLDFEVAFLAVDKDTWATSFVTDTLYMSYTHYLIRCDVYGMDVLLHGQDHAAERYLATGQEAWRAMAWKTQVDYECDPGNVIRDGGGADDIAVVNWGEGDQGDLFINDDGVWVKRVRVYVPTELLTMGPDQFRMLLWIRNFFPEGVSSMDDPLVWQLYELCLRQFGAGRIQAVALDQTYCGAPPLRPARYNMFDGLRPPADYLAAGQTWRDCSLTYLVDGSLSLDMMAMPSNEDVPVEKFFRIVVQAPDGSDIECSGDGF